jgi:hypothetical protein
MNVFIANFGRGNALWEDCKARSVITTYSDQDAHVLWRARDKEAFIELCVREKTTAAGNRVTRPVASRWYNVAVVVENTDDDLWLHHAEDDLWWTTSRAEALKESLERVEMRGADEDVIVLRKPAEAWSHLDKQGRRLRWSGLHPRARDFLTLEGTVQSLSESNADYARALIDGRSLEAWHGLPEWRAKEGRAGRGAARVFTQKELSARRMAEAAFYTAATCNGQEETRRVKNKEVVGFGDVHALERYILELYEAQEGVCAISGVELQHDEEGADRALICSLDRIDSGGHYEPRNLQVVCRFINFWKSDSADAEFRRLIRIVQTSADAG